MPNYVLSQKTYTRMINGLTGIETISGPQVSNVNGRITIADSDIDRTIRARDYFYASIQLAGPSAEADYTATDARYWFRRVFVSDTGSATDLAQFQDHEATIDNEDNPYAQWGTATNLAELDTGTRRLPKGTIVQIFRTKNQAGETKFVFNAAPPAYGFPAKVTATQCGKVTFAEVISHSGGPFGGSPAGLIVKTGGVTGTAREFNGIRQTPTDTIIWVHEVMTPYGQAGIQADAKRYEYWFHAPEQPDGSSCSSDSSSVSSSLSSSSVSSSSASSVSSSSNSSSSSSSLSSSSFSSSSFSSSSVSSSSMSSSSDSVSSSSKSSSSNSSSSDSVSSSSLSSSNSSSSFSSSSLSSSSFSSSSFSSSSFSSSSFSSQSSSSSSSLSSSSISSSISSSSLSSSSVSSSASSQVSSSSSLSSSSFSSSSVSSSSFSSSKSSSSFSSSSFSSSKSSSSSSVSSSSFSSSSSSRSSAVYSCSDCSGCPTTINYTLDITEDLSGCDFYINEFSPCFGATPTDSSGTLTHAGSCTWQAAEGVPTITCDGPTFTFRSLAGQCGAVGTITVGPDGCPQAGTYDVFTNGFGCGGTDGYIGTITISYP